MLMHEVATGAARRQYGRFLCDDPDELELARRRLALIQAVRDELRGLGYVETPVPVLCRYRESAPIRQFETRDPVTGEAYYLRHSAEEYLRRLVVAIERVFELGPVMRAEQQDSMRAMEFTMLQTAARDVALTDGVALVIDLVQAAVTAAFGGCETPRVDLTRVEVRPFDDALAEQLGLDGAIPEGALPETARTWLANEGLPADGDDWEVVEALMKYAVELRTPRPTVLIDFPWILRHNSRVDPISGKAQRFSLLINGIECVDGGVKLRTAEEYRRMIDANAALRQQLLRVPVDEGPLDFYADVDAAPCDVFTFGMGVDRVMAVCSGRSIQDLQLFPYH